MNAVIPLIRTIAYFALNAIQLYTMVQSMAFTTKKAFRK